MKKFKKIILIIFSAIILSVLLFFVLKALSGRFYDDNRAYREAKPKQSFDEGESTATDLLADARRTNGDVVAWIEIPDTAVDFPIVQGPDNSYYLRRSFQGKSARFGTPFLDYRCESDFSGFTSIVYGHNIDWKWMFAHLLDFKEQDYFDSHPYGLLTTEKKIYKVKFICCSVVKNDSMVYNELFLSDDDRVAYLDFLRDNEVTGVEFDDDEIIKKQLLVMSTCSYEFDDARTVLVGYLE